MKFTLTIDMGNAAFEGQQPVEMGYILRHLGEVFWKEFNRESFGQGEGGNLFDHNGNKVGTWEVTE